MPISAFFTVLVILCSCPALAFGEGLSLSVSSPRPGENLPGDRCTVRGTFVSPTPDLGIVVNGRPAALLEGVFIAPDIPLAEGSNRIKVLGRTVDGLSAAVSLDVSSRGKRADLFLDSNYFSGTAPLDADFHPGGHVPEGYELSYDFDGDGNPEETRSDAENVSFTFFKPGLYEAVLAWKAPNGTRGRSVRPVVVADPETLRPLLLARWGAYRSALARGEVGAALRHMSPHSRGKYGGLLRSLRPRLPEISRDMPDPLFIEEKDGRARLRLTRKEGWEGKLRDITYYLEMGRDYDGLWRIQQY